MRAEPRRLYAAFGFIIGSDVALDALTPAAEGPTDLEVVRLADAADPHLAEGQALFDVAPERQVMRWGGVGRFELEGDARVLVTPAPGAPDGLIALPLLGIVMALIVEKRGLLALHGGAVAVEGRAAIFLGDKGAGKSTMVGAMIDAGATLITDDLAAIDHDSAGAALVRPAFASIKLCHDAAGMLALEGGVEHAIPHAQIAKREMRLDARFSARPCPVEALYVLRRANVSGVVATPLSPAESLQAVLRFTFLQRFGVSRLGSSHVAAHMRRAARCVASVPVLLLEVEHDLARMPDFAETLRRRMAGEESPS